MSSTSKVTFKTMDYFKFRKYVIDGNRDDTSCCSKEVTSLMSAVQTLNLRDDEFDASDRGRFDEISTCYKQILQCRRVDSIDVRLKSGWWGEQKSGLSVGKIKPAMLLEILVAKTRDWLSRHNDGCHDNDDSINKNIEKSGMYVLKHREKSCFQIVQKCDQSVFGQCAEFFKTAFDGSAHSAIGSLLVVSLVNDWDFYFINTPDKRPDIMQIVENDLILKHDSLWPHGLNSTFIIQSPFDIHHFRLSCIRHQWPPEKKIKNIKVPPLDVNQLVTSTSEKSTAKLSGSNSNGNVTSVQHTSNLSAVSNVKETTPQRPASAKSCPAKPTNISSHATKTPQRPSTAFKGPATNSNDKSPSPVKSPSKQPIPSARSSKALSTSNTKDLKKLKQTSEAVASLTVTDSNPNISTSNNSNEDSPNSNNVPIKENYQPSDENDKTTIATVDDVPTDESQPLKRSNTFTRLDNEELYNEPA
ncbi:hypothetical protein HELRODRAFT_162005 [Helobdella robusta]|uniref:Uncharacterized protein n=1 Tax=Helobdella robusta TaxID=6412 RepID=T1ES52_HELRO|nr:hypothetical protein HELRODRAFT_162005 [Helobdella robusta]ESO02713.1 hypothetical protein HELRODRAFT_162005 [Helobdella robusta]